jgi:DnaJ family protein C protein 17
MATDRDTTDHALNSSHDFYELLEVESTANEAQLRRAYRQTALKYHPDKVGADPEKLEKFHLLQIAYDVLSDSTARQIYDNAQRARKEKEIREEQLDGRRRQLKEDLLRREREGVNELKRKRGEQVEEDAYQQRLKRLAADGARRKKEYAEKLTREAQEALDSETAEAGRPEADEHVGIHESMKTAGVDEFDRTVSVRWMTNAGGNVDRDKDSIAQQFGRFGKIEHTILTTKKIKEPDSKHRREYTTAHIVFASIVGAYTAVTEFSDLAAADPEKRWASLASVSWAGGKPPDCLLKQATPVKTQHQRAQSLENDTPPVTPKAQKQNDPLRRVPSFGSFKGTPKAVSTPSSDELLMIRLKNAERKRLADKLRQEEAEEEQRDLERRSAPIPR